MFTNTQIDIETLPKVSDIALIPVEKSYIKIVLFNLCVIFISIIGTLFGLKFLKEDSKFDSIATTLIIGLIVVFIVQFVVLVLGFKNRKYALREKDIIYTKGLLNFSTTILPFNRVQHVEISRSFLARKLNLATLEIYTAGESGSDLKIGGLPEDVAESINEYLTTMLDDRV
ncbi:PH domain-containing protein [Flavivirga aquimarina]|uniref:PH domain-containing protein n=1 Tax=Flavivirga aquimarina TaxID=2027862 RepID=A0ABT8WG77_9FLAO|nr:PH domain-containing protein [Flavivirga aquimarina]MDO5972082.1 PH domain-containing protein [Flavivirga aquimarina]